MTASNKDKRTKEQLLQILSNALTQEEQLGEKIQLLEIQLAACQKQQEDSQAEMSQYGVSASKESFRIDYYKASKNGRLKGIIEHLPSRQKKSLQGLGIKHIAQFMERFLPEEIKQREKLVAPSEAAKAKAPILRSNTEPNTVIEKSRTQFLYEGENVIPSSLAQRLRNQLQNDLLKKDETVQVVNVAAKHRSPHVERILSKLSTPTENKMLANQPSVAAATKPQLSDQLREKFRMEIPKRQGA